MVSDLMATLDVTQILHMDEKYLNAVKVHGTKETILQEPIEGPDCDTDSLKSHKTLLITIK